MEEGGVVEVRAVLFAAPVPWTLKYWSTHKWDWVEVETPLAEKPTADLEVPLDATLRQVTDAACEAWGIRPGPDQMRIAEHTGGGPYTVSDRAFWIDFFRPEDEAGYTRYGTRLNELPVAMLDGTIELRDWHDVTYQELLVSARLGLIEGDVTRPYIHLTIPQGDIGSVVQAVQATVDAIRAAYDALPIVVHMGEHGIRVVSASVPPLRHVIDDAMRLWFVMEVLRRARRRVQARMRVRNRG